MLTYNYYAEANLLDISLAPLHLSMGHWYTDAVREICAIRGYEKSEYVLFSGRVVVVFGIIAIFAGWKQKR